jgi:hypothetical protein
MRQPQTSTCWWRAKRLRTQAPLPWLSNAVRETDEHAGLRNKACNRWSASSTADHDDISDHCWQPNPPAGTHAVPQPTASEVRERPSGSISGHIHGLAAPVFQPVGHDSYYSNGRSANANASLNGQRSSSCSRRPTRRPRRRRSIRCRPGDRAPEHAREHPPICLFCLATYRRASPARPDAPIVACRRTRVLARPQRRDGRRLRHTAVCDDPRR